MLGSSSKLEQYGEAMVTHRSSEGYKGNPTHEGRGVKKKNNKGHKLLRKFRRKLSILKNVSTDDVGMMKLKKRAFSTPWVHENFPFTKKVPRIQVVQKSCFVGDTNSKRYYLVSVLIT